MNPDDNFDREAWMARLAEQERRQDQIAREIASGKRRLGGLS